MFTVIQHNRTKLILWLSSGNGYNNRDFTFIGTTNIKGELP